MLSNDLRKAYGRGLRYVGPAAFHNQGEYTRRPFSRSGRRTSYRPYNNITNPRSEPSLCEQLTRSNQLYQFTHPEPLITKQADRYSPKDLVKLDQHRPVYASRPRHEQSLRQHFPFSGYRFHQSGFQQMAEEDLQEYLSPTKEEIPECSICEELHSVFKSKVGKKTSFKSQRKATKNTQSKPSAKNYYIQHGENDFPALPNRCGIEKASTKMDTYSDKNGKSIWGCTEKVRLALGLIAKPVENKSRYNRRLSGCGILDRLCPC